MDTIISAFTRFCRGLLFLDIQFHLCPNRFQGPHFKGWFEEEWLLSAGWGLKEDFKIISSLHYSDFAVVTLADVAAEQGLPGRSMVGPTT